MRNWQRSEPPLVSILCSAYNHEPYIKNAIEGFLIQETSFPFEVLIHDDASTDRTAEIIREYEARYPDIIKPIYQTVNQYSQGFKPGAINRKRAKGKYVALCEGDDYWTDPNKLQIQADFLGKNPEYGFVHGGAVKHEVGTGRIKRDVEPPDSPKIRSSEEMFLRIIKGQYCQVYTCTVMYRLELRKKLEHIHPEIYGTSKRMFMMGDTPLLLDMSRITKFKYISKPLAVYKSLPESASRSQDPRRRLEFFNNGTEMRMYYLNKYGYPEKIKRQVWLNRHLFLLLRVSTILNDQTAAQYAVEKIRQSKEPIPPGKRFAYQALRHRRLHRLVSALIKIQRNLTIRFKNGFIKLR